jgi:hypothetical protein
VFDSEFADVATLFGEEPQQKFDTVAVAAECVRAESPLTRQVIDEEPV